MSWKRTKCVVVTCQATPQKFPDRKFFRFPNPENENYMLWLNKLDSVANKIKTLKKPYICSIHFENKYLGLKKLKKFAVPSLFLDSQENPDSDLTFEELNHMEQNTNDIQVDIVCSYCEKSARNIRFYCNKINRLQREIENLKSFRKNVLKKNKILKNNYLRYRKLYKKKSFVKLDEDIDSLNNVSSHAKVFSKLILNSHKSCYSNEEKWLSQCIFFRSTSGYKFLRETLNFNLPSISSLHNWIDIKRLSPGLNCSIINQILKQISHLKNHEKEVVLLFDEMSIQENFTYNEVDDRIDGFIHYSDGERDKITSKSVCVFMIRSLTSNFKQVLHYVSSPGTIPTDILNCEIKNCLKILDHFQLNVRAIVCDQGPTNRKLFNQLNISAQSPYCIIDNKKIFGAFDACHLIKSIRNNLSNSNLITPDGEISWDVVVFLYRFEELK